MGGLITGLIGVLMMPWKLVANPKGYIFTWLIAYSALLGPIGGILIADYFVWRRRQLNLHALYQPAGEYRFTRGFSMVAVIALAIGILPSVPGFLVQIEALAAEKVAPSLVSLYSYAWFIGFAIAFVAYLAGRKITALAPPTVAVDQPQTAIR
jgi:NCS1 family nucleobase:cation symporter-1